MGYGGQTEREEAEAKKIKTGPIKAGSFFFPPLAMSSSASPSVSQGSSSHSVATFQGWLLIGKLSAHVETALP